MLAFRLSEVSAGQNNLSWRGKAVATDPAPGHFGPLVNEPDIRSTLWITAIACFASLIVLAVVVLVLYNTPNSLPTRQTTLATLLAVGGLFFSLCIKLLSKHNDDKVIKSSEIQFSNDAIAQVIILEFGYITQSNYDQINSTAIFMITTFMSIMLYLVFMRWIIRSGMIRIAVGTFASFMMLCLVLLFILTH